MLVDINNPLINWIFPPRCVVCGQDISHGTLCSICSSMVTKAPPTISTIKSAKPALFFYEGVIKQLVLSAKYYRSLHHAEALMQLVQPVLNTSTILQEISSAAPDCVCAIPSHWLNRLVRSVDLPQLFALTIARMLVLPFIVCFKRTNYFHRQTRAINRSERLRGIERAFSLTAVQAKFAHILVIDDVVTTGATFDEANKLLKRRGKVTTCLAIAKTP